MLIILLFTAQKKEVIVAVSRHYTGTVLCTPARLGFVSFVLRETNSRNGIRAKRCREVSAQIIKWI